MIFFHGLLAIYNQYNMVHAAKLAVNMQLQNVWDLSLTRIEPTISQSHTSLCFMLVHFLKLYTCHV